MSSLISFFTIITFLSGIITSVYKILNLSDFEEISIPKYKLSLYRVVWFTLAVFFVNSFIFGLSYLLNIALKVNAGLASFIDKVENILLVIILLTSVAMMLINTFSSLINISKLISHRTESTEKINVHYTKCSTAKNHAYITIFLLGLLAFCIYYAIVIESTFFHIQDKNIFKILIYALIFFVLSWIIIGIYIFGYKEFREQRRGYKAKFKLGKTYLRKDINETLYILDSKGDNELM